MPHFTFSKKYYITNYNNTKISFSCYCKVTLSQLSEIFCWIGFTIIIYEYSFFAWHKAHAVAFWQFMMQIADWQLSIRVAKFVEFQETWHCGPDYSWLPLIDFDQLCIKSNYFQLLLESRYRPRFLDQVEHETMYASSGNKYFFTKSCHCQTYQNYEQSRQKLGTILGNKVS